MGKELVYFQTINYFQMVSDPEAWKISTLAVILAGNGMSQKKDGTWI